MLIVINADDLGAGPSINDEIFELMSLGLVTSATLMANAPAFQDAVERMKDFPNCSFGVHLNLTDFAPLSSGKDLQQILDGDGRMSTALFKTPIDSNLRKAALQELTLQGRRAIEAGVPVSHFDSHQHIHTIPQLFPVFKRLQRDFGITKFRSSINLLPPGDKMSAGRGLKKWAFTNAFKHLPPATRSPEGFGDFRDFHARLRSGNCPTYPQLELMVHPGTTGLRYREEISLLRSDWRNHLPDGVRLGSYHDV